MNYGGIDEFENTNGEGWGVTLYVSGCYHNCKGCHNPELWCKYAGKEFTNDTMNKILELLNNPHISRFTLCGGEPMLYPPMVEYITSTIRKVKPNIKIWCYTGYTFEELGVMVFKGRVRKYLKNIDVLIDGRYIEALNRPRPIYRGSSNQRIIDVKETLKMGEIIIKEVR